MLTLLRNGFIQRLGAWRGCELRKRDLSAKIEYLAKEKYELTTKFAISPNGCYAFGSIYSMFVHSNLFQLASPNLIILFSFKHLF